MVQNDPIKSMPNNRTYKRQITEKYTDKQPKSVDKIILNGYTSR